MSSVSGIFFDCIHFKCNRFLRKIRFFLENQIDSSRSRVCVQHFDQVQNISSQKRVIETHTKKKERLIMGESWGCVIFKLSFPYLFSVII